MEEIVKQTLCAWGKLIQDALNAIQIMNCLISMIRTLENALVFILSCNSFLETVHVLFDLSDGTYKSTQTSDLTDIQLTQGILLFFITYE